MKASPLYIPQIGALGLICGESADTLNNFREQYTDVETCLSIPDVLKEDAIHGVHHRQGMQDPEQCFRLQGGHA
ncbi:hypothetical protein DESC_290093 [Desulfosarcina cetonica]|nr:hypothetical protein DESC_290093 [Desulfosarcina cetonica]